MISEMPELETFSGFCDKLNDYGRKGIPFIFIVDYKGEKPRLWKPAEVNPGKVLYDFRGYRNVATPAFPTKKPVLFEKFPVDFHTYKKGFDIVTGHIRAGNSFLVNYSAPTPIRTNLSLQDIYEASAAPYRFWLKDEFVCFSPEIFVTVKGDRISSHPMKGTIDADIPDAALLLLNDPKEMAEHATIVDLIRNDLSRIAQRVWVERYRYLDTITTHHKRLLQASTEIAGTLPAGFNRAFGDLLGQMLPAGSITGAPKPSTIRIIQHAENYERGYYTGVMGYFDGNTFESAVMIRYIEQQKGEMIFKSGGGITSQSNVHAEYREMIDKVYLPIPNPSIPSGKSAP